MTQVRLQIHGERGAITVDTLVAALQRTLIVLREVDRTSRGERASRGAWRVEEVWNGSIGVVLAPSADVPSEVPERLVAGLTLLEERPELPPWFSESAIHNVQKMGKILRQPGVSGLGLTAVTSARTETEARLTPEIIEHAAEAFQGTDEASGSVAGDLDVVNLRRGQRTVSLYDADERHAVRCTFPLASISTPTSTWHGSERKKEGSTPRASCSRLQKHTDSPSWPVRSSTPKSADMERSVLQTSKAWTPRSGRSSNAAFSGGSRWTYQRLATLGRYPGSSDSEEPTPSTCRRRSEERQSAS